jgi:mannose-6-phosphate isomerase-like protein (cupin superfamily)
MKRKNLRFESGFRVIPGNRFSQAAEMVLPRGRAEGGPDNRHQGAGQWLYMVSGTGIATINGKRYCVGEVTFLLIERGDEQEIRNNGDDLLRPLNFDVPPGYGKEGEELPAARVDG